MSEDKTLKNTLRASCLGFWELGHKGLGILVGLVRGSKGFLQGNNKGFLQFRPPLRAL